MYMSLPIKSDINKEYTFYFGLWGSGVGSATNKPRPWKLNHVLSYGVTIDSKSTEVGIPTVGPEGAMVFDVSGPVREFTITGVRYDNEEEISNIDFIFSLISENYTWIDEYGISHENCFSAGLAGMFSLLQVGIRGFVFAVLSSEMDENFETKWIPNPSVDYPGDDEDFLIETGIYNVAFNGLEMEYLPQPGGIKYTIRMIECEIMGNGDYMDLIEEGKKRLIYKGER